MKTKLMLLLPSLLLTGCSQTYMADHSLKQSWSQELENTQPSQIPYALVYDLGAKKLIYVAASSDTRSQSNTIIHSLIEKWKPQVVLLQGHTSEQILLPSQVNICVKGYKPLLKGASAGRDQVIDNLVNYGITERDYIIYKVLLLANQDWQFETKTPEALKYKMINYLKTDPHAKKFHLTYEDVKKWFYEKMRVPLTDELLLDGEILAPKDPNLQTTTLLQKISSYEDEIDDMVVMDSLSDELDEEQIVMIIRAPSKFVTERNVLHKMLGVTQPSEIVN